NQLGDFVIRLELAAVDLEDGFGRPVEDFSQGLNRARLTRPRGSEQQENAGRSIGRRERRLIHLHVRHDVLQRRRLPDDLAGQQLDECASALGRRLLRSTWIVYHQCAPRLRLYRPVTCVRVTRLTSCAPTAPARLPSTTRRASSGCCRPAP